MSNFFSRTEGEFNYQSGAQIVYSVRVDREKLSRMVYRVATNKTGKGKRGGFLIEARFTKPPAGEATTGFLIDG